MQYDSFEEKPHDLNELLDLIVEQASDFTKAERTLIYLYDADEKVLWNRAGQGAEFMELEFEIGKGVPGKSISEERVFNISDVGSDSDYDAGMDNVTDVEVKSMVVAPILDVSKGKKIGVIQLINKDGGFDDKDVAFVKSIAAQAAIAIDNTILFSTLQQIRERERELAEEVKRQNVEISDAYVKLEEEKKEEEESSKKTSRNKTIAMIGSIVVFVGIGFLVWRSASFSDDGGGDIPFIEDEEVQLVDAEGNPLNTYTVVGKPLRFPLTLSGILEPSQIQNMFAPFSGRIVTQNFTVGDEVVSGQELLLLDDEVVEESYKKAVLDEIQAQEEYDKYLDWENGEEVFDAKRKLLDAEKRLTKQEEKYEQSVKLHGLGIISDVNLETEAENLDNAKRVVDNEQRSLSKKLEEGDAEAVQAKALVLQAAQRKARDLKEKVDRASVRSRIDGVAINPQTSGSKSKNEQPVEVGVTLAEGRIFVSVADLSRLRVLGRVDESDINKVKVGQSVRIRGNAFPGITLKGTVDYVSSEARKGGRRPYFEIRVMTLPLSEDELKVIRLGMSADLSIVTYENPKALMVPFEAIKITHAGSFVFKVKPGQTEPERVQVKTGVTTQDEVELTSGVAEGDQLLIIN